jgi:hypothetical protein
MHRNVFPHFEKVFPHFLGEGIDTSEILRETREIKGKV